MSHRRTPALLLGLALSVLPARSDEAPPPEAPPYARIEVRWLSDLPTRDWPRYQFVQADQQGRVFVLRSDDLSLHQLTPGGRLLAKGFLTGALEEKDRFVDAAALSPAGDVWVVFGPPNQLEVFRTGKSVLRLESSWVVSAIAAAPEGPVVAVLPAEIDTPTAASYRSPIPPLLERWDGKRWETLVEGEIGPDRATTGASHLEFLNGFSSLLTLSPNGHFWIADKNAARLRHFSALSELQEEIRIGLGEVAWAPRTPQDFERMEKAAKGGGFKFDRRTVSPVQATSVYRAIVQGREGFVYLLAETRDGLALDRFDPTLPSYDRVLLPSVDLPLGRVTLAAGAHSLLLGARLARDGIWEISNEALDEADWHQVPEASVNGKPIPERKREDQTTPPATTRPQGSPTQNQSIEAQSGKVPPPPHGH